MAQVPPTSPASGASINNQTHNTSAQTLPSVLREGNIKQPIEGRIAEHRLDGTTRIETRHGPVDVRIANDKPPIGARVSVEVTPKASGEAQIKIQVQHNSDGSVKIEQALPRAAAPQNTAQPTNTPAPTNAEQARTNAPPSQGRAIDAATAQRPDTAAQTKAANFQTLQNATLNRAALPPLESAQAPAQIAAKLRTPIVGELIKIISQPATTQAFKAIQVIETASALQSAGLNSGALASGKTLNAVPLNSSISNLITSLTQQSAPTSNLGTAQNLTTRPPVLATQAALSTNTGQTSGTLSQTISTTIGTQSATIGTQNLWPQGVNQSPALSTTSINTPQVNSATTSPLTNTHITLQGLQINVNARITGIFTPPTASFNQTAAGQSILGNIGQSVQNILSPAKAGEITAIVGHPVTASSSAGIGSEAAGALRTPVTLFNGSQRIAGQFLLPTGMGNIPPGTQITLSILDAQSFAPNGQPMNAAFKGLEGLQQALAENDLFLDDILKVLESLHGKIPAESLNAALRFMPQAASPSRLGSTILFFMAALKGGDIKQWLGDRNASILQNSAQNALSGRLERSFSALSRMFSDPAQVQGGEWRSFQMPMLFGPDLTRLQFHIRDYHHENKGQDGENENTPLKRVIIDFTMSRMGEMQIDSLLMNKRLETILRTADGFSPTMKQDLRQRYTSIMRGIGYEGHLDFQSREPS